jgi:hypothetical protein
MHIFDVEDLMETALREIMAAHYPHHWREDSITDDLLIRLKKYFHSPSLVGTRFPIQIEWEMYKLNGLRESDHGDIGLLVRYRLPSGRTVEGAGFLEAKVRGLGTTKFKQVRSKQVTRILSRSPLTRLLLYDYNPVAVLDNLHDSDAVWDLVPSFPRHRAGYARITHGPVLPLQIASAVNVYDDTLYRFCHSFSHQFSRRYFHLHDLDFTKQAVRAVKGFPGKLPAPNFIMVIRGAPAGKDLPEEFRPDQNYRAIE